MELSEQYDSLEGREQSQKDNEGTGVDIHHKCDGKSLNAWDRRRPKEMIFLATLTVRSQGSWLEAL